MCSSCPRTADRVSRLVTPLKPFEAMALERAVVVSDLPALREIVDAGRDGDDLQSRATPTTSLGVLERAARRRPRSAPGSAARPGSGSLAERTWAQNGRRYRELYERLGVA